jgi:hypothetical protein
MHVWRVLFVGRGWAYSPDELSILLAAFVGIILWGPLKQAFRSSAGC